MDSGETTLFGADDKESSLQRLLAFNYAVRFSKYQNTQLIDKLTDSRYLILSFCANDHLCTYDAFLVRIREKWSHFQIKTL